MNNAMPGAAPEEAVRELQELLHSPISPEQYYRRYLQLLTGSLPGLAGAHLWILQGRDFVPLGGSDREPLLYDKDQAQKNFLDSLMRTAASRQETVVAAAAADGNHCAQTLAVTPLLYGKGGGAVQGAQICWWEKSHSKQDAESAGRLLDVFAALCAQMVRAQRLESMSQLSGQLQLMTQFLGELSTSQDAKTLAITVVNRAREAAECDRCAMITVRPGPRFALEAISNVPAADPHSTTARTLLQLAEHARNTGLPALFRKASEKTEERGDLSDYFYHSHMQEALVVGLRQPGEELDGLLVLESAHLNFFDQARNNVISSLVTQAAVPLHTALLREQIPFRNWLEKIARWRRLPPEEKKKWKRQRLWIPAAAIALVAFFPVRLQFTGEAKLLPQERALAVAQVEGRVVEILAAVGDTLSKGQPLAQLDDTELRKQYEIAAQEETRLKAEADRLLSLNERTAAQVAQLALQRARREKEFHKGRLDLAVIRSPIDGVVMTPELRSRQGDALQPGSQLALIGSPSAWDLEISLRETDVAAVLVRLHEGREVPVRFKLAAIPQKTFTTNLGDPANVAAASEVVSGQNTFRIVLPLPGDPEYDALFRAGYTGRARLVMGYRPFAYNVLRRFFNWTRTTIFF